MFPNKRKKVNLTVDVSEIINKNTYLTVVLYNTNAPSGLLIELVIK